MAGVVVLFRRESGAAEVRAAARARDELRCALLVFPAEAGLAVVVLVARAAGVDLVDAGVHAAKRLEAGRRVLADFAARVARDAGGDAPLRLAIRSRRAG